MHSRLCLHPQRRRKRLQQLLGLVLLVLSRLSKRLPSPSPIRDGRRGRVALGDVLDDALGPAYVDLVAVLALHIIAVAILAPGAAWRGSRLSSLGWRTFWWAS